jgi:hypothetical protein
MTDIVFMLVKQFVLLMVTLSGAMPAGTWLHHTELGLASSETECEST